MPAQGTATTPASPTLQQVDNASYQHVTYPADHFGTVTAIVYGPW